MMYVLLLAVDMHRNEIDGVFLLPHTVSLAHALCFQIHFFSSVLFFPFQFG